MRVQSEMIQIREYRMPETPDQMKRLISAVAAMTDEMTKMTHKLDETAVKVGEMAEIVQAWEAMKVGGRFVKWLAGIGSGIAGIWIVLKAVGASFFK